jgi:glycosyltransferase involved in cell wall biosynthesis
VPVIPAALKQARRRLPDLRAEVYGDGPDRAELLRAIHAEGLGDAIAAPGFVDGPTVDRALARALCMLLPSRREGYGMVVVEASARGTPSVVVDGPDNAATELVDEGRNGFVARSADPSEIADAILRVHEAGAPLRDATAEWFNENARRLSLDSSLDTVVERYGSR